jgi:T-complex protein 1 subunit gamma
LPQAKLYHSYTSKMQAPVVVMNTQTPGGERQFGRKAQISNITAAKTVADIIRSCLGPKAMLKMLLDPMGGIVLTNDGHAILREIEVAHPAAKSMIELSRTQDEEVGDGTTTVIILGTHASCTTKASLTANSGRDPCPGPAPA